MELAFAKEADEADPFLPFFWASLALPLTGGVRARLLRPRLNFPLIVAGASLQKSWRNKLS